MTSVGPGPTGGWGTADGPATRLAPQVRILAGAALFAACLVVVPSTVNGTGFLAATVAGWLAVCGVSGRVVRSALLLALALFLPLVLLVPLMPNGSGLPELWNVVGRGASGMLVSIGTAATLPAAELDEGLARLPLPSVVTALLSQILRQVGALTDETRRISAAIAVRAAGSGPRQALRVLVAMPRTWLPRVAARADRVASAMDLRGLGSRLPRFREVRLRGGDLVAGLVVLLWLGLAVVLRAWGVR